MLRHASIKNHFSKGYNLVTLYTCQYSGSLFSLGHICVKKQEKEERKREKTMEQNNSVYQNGYLCPEWTIGEWDLFIRLLMAHPFIQSFSQSATPCKVLTMSQGLSWVLGDSWESARRVLFLTVSPWEGIKTWIQDPVFYSATISLILWEKLNHKHSFYVDGYVSSQ